MALTVQELKKAFAYALIERPGKPFEVAFAIFRDNAETSQALYAATYWPNDPEVLEYQRVAIANPDEAGLLPTKQQFAHEVLQRCRAEQDTEVYVKIATLYASITGHIEKPSTGASNTINNLPNAKIILMPTIMERDAFSTKATQQQKTLTIEGERIANER